MLLVALALTLVAGLSYLAGGYAAGRMARGRGRSQGLAVWIVGLTAQVPPADPWRPLAERYVKLVLAVGQHDADYVVAFDGPAEWRTEAELAKVALDALDRKAAALEAEVGKATVPADPTDRAVWTLRRVLEPAALRGPGASRDAAGT